MEVRTTFPGVVPSLNADLNSSPLTRKNLSYDKKRLVLVEEHRHLLRNLSLVVLESIFFGRSLLACGLRLSQQRHDRKLRKNLTSSQSILVSTMGCTSNEWFNHSLDAVQSAKNQPNQLHNDTSKNESTKLFGYIVKSDKDKNDDDEKEDLNC